MTLLKLVERMRNTLDDKGGTNGDWTDSSIQSRLRWTNEELIGYINEAERETAIRTHELIDAETSEVCQIDVVTGTHTYEIHNKIITIERAKLLTGLRPLSETSWKDIEAVRPDWETATGTPEYYMRDWQKGKIRLYPIPIADGTLNLNVYRLPLDDMELDSWDADEPEIDAQYQDKMLSWGMHLAYQKDEPNTLDPDKVMFYLQKFESEVGPSVNMYSIERRKKKNRQTGYGGIRQTTGGSSNRMR